MKQSIRIVSSAIVLAVLNFIPFGTDAAGFAVKLLLFVILFIFIGYENLKEAVEGVAEGEVLDENFLMAIASIGAFVLAVIDKSGDYNEAVLVMLLFNIGEFFEEYAVDKSKDNITSLMDIRPDSARVLTEEGEKTVSPDEVPVQSVIIVLPGEKIPIDGVICEGKSVLDTAALTGESRPQTVDVGDEVISGCINLSGVLKIKTIKEFGESTVSKILNLVENASERKASSEKFISKFARVYTPAVCIMAVAIAFLIPLIRMMTGNSADFVIFLYRALTFLVISCPCALVISVPLSFFAGIGGASKAGILVKGSNYLETLSQIGTVVFDKTGTLTKGVFEVSKINSTQGDEKEFLKCAAYAEQFSSHPISISLRKAYEKSVAKDFAYDEGKVTDVQEISGEGISAVVFGRQVLVGNRKLLERFKIDFTKDNKEDGLNNSAGTTVYVAIDHEFAGEITISDTLKDSSPEAINALKKLSVNNTIMLTGDEESVAKCVAKELGITSHYAGLLPQDKVSRMEDIIDKAREKSEKVAFVGDGINDAPVLMRADVGIAMGALGSDAAIEAADIVIMDDDPLKVAKAVSISRKCMRIVYENIWFAIGIKVICLILGATGIAGMWLAVFADVGVMIIAVLNALRALRVGIDRKP